MGELHRRAQALADTCGHRCWIVTPRHGRPYIAYTPAQIQPSYQQLETVLPSTLAGSGRPYPTQQPQ
jgi:hypothetical protein